MDHYFIPPFIPGPKILWEGGRKECRSVVPCVYYTVLPPFKENLNGEKSFPGLGGEEKLTKKAFKKNIHLYRQFFEEYLRYLYNVRKIEKFLILYRDNAWKNAAPTASVKRSKSSNNNASAALRKEFMAKSSICSNRPCTTSSALKNSTISTKCKIFKNGHF